MLWFNWCIVLAQKTTHFTNCDNQLTGLQSYYDIVDYLIRTPVYGVTGNSNVSIRCNFSGLQYVYKLGLKLQLSIVPGLHYGGIRIRPAPQTHAFWYSEARGDQFNLWLIRSCALLVNYHRH